jgi:hypothetical protein
VVITIPIRKEKVLESGNKIIKFTSEASDLNQDYTLNFSGTTARSVKKSPYDTSDKVIPTALQFYKSEIPTIENLKFY